MLQIIIFGLTWWFGLYLISRDWRSPLLCFTGLGLASYALALALRIIADLQPEAGWIRALAQFAPFVPVVCWVWAIVALLPAGIRYARPLRGLLFGTSFGTIGFGVLASLVPSPNVQTVAGTLGVLGIVIVLVLLWQHARAVRPANSVGLLLAATLFFTLGVALLLLPLQLVAQPWMLLAIGGDLALLGFAVVRLDAFQQGEQLLPDMLRSLDGACIAAALIAGQIGLVIAFGSGPSVPMVILLCGVLASTIGLNVFANAVQHLIDSVVLARFPAVRQAREELRATADVLPRLAPAFDFHSIDEDEFARMTRRALSNFGHLPRLATNPLVYLPQIDERLATRNLPDDVLGRASELKVLLAERIERLKPRDGNFGTTDEWRFYNALYFPYVLGLKPYNRRTTNQTAHPETHDALAWFQSDVPERTLYNWQNTAARLLADNLREEALER